MTITINPNLLWSCLVSFGLLLSACNQAAPAPENELHSSHVQDAPENPQIGEALAVIPTNVATTDEGTRPESAPSSTAPIEKLSIAPPIAGVDVPFQTYRFNAEDPKEIVTPTGTRIKIPASAFVDQAGKAVQGEVVIRYREFHTAADIITSGIPMHEPETGNYMETAGMFEIKGAQNGEEIFMSASKPVKIDMVSQVAGNQYNFYQLGAKDCRWQDKGTAPATPNTPKIAALKKLDAELKQQQSKAKPRFVKSSQTNNFVFDLEVDYRRQPELKTFKNVVWEYTGEGADPEQNEWVFSEGTRWDGVKIEPLDNGYYEMIFHNSAQEFRTTVRPVLTDKDYDKALEAFNQRTAAATAAFNEQQEFSRQYYKSQGDLMRSFEVSEFAIYNWDCWKSSRDRRYHLDPRFDILAQEVLQKTGTDNVQYYLVSSNNRSVVSFRKEMFSAFTYNPKEKNTIVAILPNGQAAVVKPSAFEAFEKKILKDRFKVNLVTSEEIITSAADLKRLMTEG